MPTGDPSKTNIIKTEDTLPLQFVAKVTKIYQATNHKILGRILFKKNAT